MAGTEDRIIARLKVNWREALIECPEETYRTWHTGRDDPMSFTNAGRALLDMMLIEWHPDPRCSETRLTELGKLVRARLIDATPAQHMPEQPK